jgi:hypothetical protein
VAERDQRIGIRACGVELRLGADAPELLDAIAGLVPGLVGPPGEAPDLEVRAHWIGGPRDRGRSWFPDPPGPGAVGKRMRIGPDELVWFKTYRDRDLQLRFARRDRRPVFDVAYCYQPSTKKLAEQPDFKQKKFFDLLRYLVHFPIAWHLERTRGWALLHASAVVRGDRALLVAGPGGAGKTTTCLALAARAGMTLLGENLLLCDGARVHPVEEPIRLTEEGLALLGEDFRRLQPIELEGGLKRKRLFGLPRSAAAAAAPAALFLPRFAQPGYARRLEPAVACELLEASNRLTLELSDYAWYAAALDLLWPQPGTARGRLRVLERLTSATPCWALGIDRAAGVEPVVDRVLRCLDATEPGS